MALGNPQTRITSRGGVFGSLEVVDVKNILGFLKNLLVSEDALTEAEVRSLQKLELNLEAVLKAETSVGTII